jgi:ankyrin repeat protein
MTLDDVLREVADLPDFYSTNVDSVHSRGINGDTPLHAVVHWNCLEKVRLLVEAGADVNARGELGKTPLHYAMWEGNDETIDYLLRNGADQNVVDDLGFTPARRNRVRDEC